MLQLISTEELSGEKDGIELRDVKEKFEGKIEGMVEGGPTEIKVASTIVKLENHEWKVLREGTIKIEE